MATLWRKNSAGTWAPMTYYARADTGWKYAEKVYQKTNSTTWTERWARDTGAPAAPTITHTIYSDENRVRFSITIPNESDVTRMIIKQGYEGYALVPSSAAETGQSYFTFIESLDGTVWSERTVSPGQVVLRDNSGYTRGVTYYYTAWVQDAMGNWSAAGHDSLVMPVVSAPPTTTTTKSIYLNCGDSGTWYQTEGYWRPDRYVYQAGPFNSYGFWLYGGTIQNTLANAKSLTNMMVYIQRMNTTHGVAGEGNVYLSHHTTLSKTNDTPSITGGVYLGTLGRGEGQWFTVPSAWWPYFLSGGYAGLGVHHSQTTTTDVKYMQYYGLGTKSGQVYLVWEE